MVCAVLLGAVLRGEDGPAPCAGCNVVVISMDTLRADHVGAYGYALPTTPAIDTLARRAVVFEDAVSQSAWTRPAHASMLTGLYPSEHGIVGMAGRPALAPELPTLAGELRDRGYATAAFTGGANMSSHFGFDSGFDVYRSPGRRFEDGLPEVERWLDATAEPFFLFVHGLDAHRPFKSRPADRRALGLPREPARGLMRACRGGAPSTSVAPFIAEYDAAIHRGDSSIGKLLAALEARELGERTVVVVTSDHGEEFLEHGRCFHIRTVYREVVRVPLIIAAPGLAPRRVSGVVPASVAVAPTVLDAIGVRDSAIPGPSLLPAMRSGRSDHEYVVSETSSRRTDSGGGGDVRSLTGDHSKLVRWLSQGRSEYFDLIADPYEQRSLPQAAGQAPLDEALTRWEAAHPARVDAPEAGRLPAALARELEALGYVE